MSTFPTNKLDAHRTVIEKWLKSGENNGVCRRMKAPHVEITHWVLEKELAFSFLALGSTCPLLSVPGRGPRARHLYVEP